MIGKECPSPLESAAASTVLGAEDFVTEILERHVSGRAPDRDLPALQSLSGSLSPEAIHAATEVLSADGLARKAAIHICHRYSGAKLGVIAEYFQLSYSGVTQASKRFGEAMERDEKLREKVVKIRRRLNLSNV